MITTKLIFKCQIMPTWKDLAKRVCTLQAQIIESLKARIAKLQAQRQIDVARIENILSDYAILQRMYVGLLPDRHVMWAPQNDARIHEEAIASHNQE